MLSFLSFWLVCCCMHFYFFLLPVFWCLVCGKMKNNDFDCTVHFYFILFYFIFLFCSYWQINIVNWLEFIFVGVEKVPLRGEGIWMWWFKGLSIVSLGITCMLLFQGFYPLCKSWYIKQIKYRLLLPMSCMIMK